MLIAKVVTEGTDQIVFPPEITLDCDEVDVRWKGEGLITRPIAP